MSQRDDLDLPDLDDDEDSGPAPTCDWCGQAEVKREAGTAAGYVWVCENHAGEA